MANEKVLQTRLSLKYDTYANWTNLSEAGKGGNLVLNKGEVGFCEIPAGNGAATTAPTVLFKVGTYDGVNAGTKVAFKDLKWASALAADVYDWAKKPQADFEAWAKGLVPVEVIDNGSGKFVTDVTATNDANGHHITITRDDAVNTLTTTDDDVVVLTADKSKGDVTLDAKHAKKGPSTKYTGGQTAGTADAFGESVTIKVPKLTVDTYGHVNSAADVEYKVAIPNNPNTWRGVAVNGTIHQNNNTASGNLNLTNGDHINIEFDDEDTAVVINHGAKPTTGTKETATNGTGRTYVTEVLTDAYGHIAGVKTATETVTDTNTAHAHEDGLGTKVTDDGGTDGTVAVNLNLAFNSLTADNKLQLVDATSKTVVAEFDATEFVKDSFLKEASYDDSENILTLKFLDTENNIEDIYVDLSALVDVYTADEKTLTRTTGTDGSTQFKIKAEGVGADELATAIKQEIAKGVSAYGWGNHANAGYLKSADITGKADKVSGATAGNFAALDANGNLTDSGKKAADFQPAGNYKTKQTAVSDQKLSGATVFKGIAQDANGAITVSTRDLTPGDIGAASAPADKNVYLELINNGDVGKVTWQSSGFETINFDDDLELQYGGNEVLTTASTISTDKLYGGSEIWIIDCGTSTTVI